MRTFTFSAMDSLHSNTSTGMNMHVQILTLDPKSYHHFQAPDDHNSDCSGHYGSVGRAVHGCTTLQIGQSRIKAEECCSVRTG